MYSFIVPGGTLGTDKKLRGEMIANYNNTSGGAVTLTIRLKYGGNTYALKTLALPNNLNPATLQIEFFLANMFGSTGGQRGGFSGIIDDTCFVGCGVGTGTQISFAAVGFAGTNSTLDQPLQITVQHSVAGGTGFEKQFAILELL